MMPYLDRARTLKRLGSQSHLRLSVIGSGVFRRPPARVMVEAGPRFRAGTLEATVVQGLDFEAQSLAARRPTSRNHLAIA